MECYLKKSVGGEYGERVEKKRKQEIAKPPLSTGERERCGGAVKFIKRESSCGLGTVWCVTTTTTLPYHHILFG